MLLQDEIPDRLPSLKKKKKIKRKQRRITTKEREKTQIRPETRVGEAICIFFNKKRFFSPFFEIVFA